MNSRKGEFSKWLTPIGFLPSWPSVIRPGRLAASTRCTVPCAGPAGIGAAVDDLDAPFRRATPRQIQLALTLTRAREQLDVHGPTPEQLERIAELERQLEDDHDD